MGEGVAVYDKAYFSVRLELSAAMARAAGVRWVLDSAASNSLITPTAATLLEARSTGVTATADTASTTGASGFQQVDLGMASLTGGLESGPLRPVVMELPVGGECGLLGLDFLSRHDVDLRLRPATPCAVFHSPGSTARGDVDTEGLSELECARLPSGLLTTTVRLLPEGGAGGAVQAIVDLGSTLTLCNWAAARAAGLSPEDPRVRVTDDVIAGASGEPIRVSEARLLLELGGGARRENVLVNIADLPVFAAVGMPGPAAVLGLDALAARADSEAAGSRVVLAVQDARVWVETVAV